MSTTEAAGHHQDQPKRALVVIAIAAILYSLIPISVDLSGSTEKPLTVGAGFVVGTVAASAIIRRRASPEGVLSYRAVWQRCRQPYPYAKTLVVSLVLVAISGFDFVLFAWSTAHVDTAVSSSLFQLWPVAWFALLKAIDRRRSGAYPRVPASIGTYALLSTGGLSAALVVLSTGTSGDGSDGSFPVMGIALALAGPLVSSLGVFCFLFAHRVTVGDTSERERERSGLRNAELSHNLTGFVIGRAATVPMMCALAVWESGLTSVAASLAFWGGVVGGVLLHGPAAAMVRAAHTLTVRREIVAVQYWAPALSLGWLALFLGINVERVDFLMVGTAALILVNVALSTVAARQAKTY